ncbi:MAG: fibronectin type III domain-containing protein [Chitinophagaceae bacterium]|nr:fibronectin type III domain-containing protein [Chitinophagaceae bacterium]
MRKIYLMLLTVCFAAAVNGQITITVTGNTNTTPNLLATYPSLAAALTDLNAVTAMTGPVVLTCDAGTSETAPVKGFALGSATLNPVLSSTNTITINKTGGVVTINAAVGTANGPSATPDGMLYLNGADHVTIDGLTFTDGNVASATVAMEFGIALFKRAVGDGCNNNTIQNCTFNMQRINNNSGSTPMLDGSWAIEVLNSTAAAATTSLTPTNGGTLATNGTNSGNKFYANSINSGNGGIGFGGFAATLGVGPAPTATTFLGDLSNDVGGSALATGNTILNFGGGAATSPAAGIRANNQWSINISYNTINNNDGGGVNHATTLRGIYAQAGTSANATITNNTVTVKSAATTSACTGIENVIGSTAAANTININNNTIQNCTYTTATTATFTGILSSATAATVNINSNTVNNNNIGAAATASSCTFQGIYSSASATNFIASNNTITNNSVLNQGGTLYCLRGSTSLLTWNNNNINTNSFPNHGAALSASLHGMYDLSSPTQENFSGNTIYNQTISGSSTSTSSVINGIIMNTSSSSIKNWTGNDIHTLTFSNSSTGAAVVNGVSQSLGATVNIFKNKIYDLTSNGSASTVNGILITSGTNLNIYNNLIGDLKTPSASANDAIRGISSTSTTTSSTINVYYNTVYLNATSSGVNFGTSGIFHTTSATATTAALNLRNNIIVNTSTPAGTGFTVAYRRSSTTLTNFVSTSNNNDFYASATTASPYFIFYDGTTGYQIAGYKTLVAPRDATSVSEDPSFQSIVGANANFLKYDVLNPKQIESGAVNIATFTDDYIGTIRQGNGGYAGTGTAPDMGAWELEGIAADLTGPSISYTGFTNTSCLTDRTLSPVTITDASGVNITAGTRPRLYYKKSVNANTFVDNTNATDGWKYVEATGVGGSPFSFTTDYSLLFGGVPVTTDVIQYFVVAQDNAGTPNIGINSGIFAATPASVALTAAAFPLTGTINSYTVVAPGLIGTVTIGAAGTYTSISGTGGLFDAINTGGMSGNLVANILDASVTETGTVALNAINYNGCVAGPYTLTIKPNTTSTLTGSVGTGAIIKLNGADYVTIDGSNSGGSDRSLTIENTTTTTSGNAVVWLASPASGNGATNNTIKNCIIQGNAATTTFTGVHIGGSTTIGLTTAGTELNSNNTINNNLLRKSQYGVTMFGFAAASPDQNNIISNNNFGTAVTGEGFSLLAINADRQLGLVVSGNEVQNVVNATNTSSTPFGGIRLLDFKNGQCYNNRIHDLAYTGTSTPKIYGIAITSGSYTTVGNPSNALVYNNSVARITSTGVSSVWNTTGILASAGYGDRFYYNSVHLTGQLANSSSGLAAAFANGDGNITSVCTNIDVRNNSFSLTGSSAVAGGNFWAYYSAATTVAGSTLNYNDLYCNGTNATNNVGRFNATNHANLAAWQAATGQEANSISVDPLYNSITNLQPQLGSPLVGAGNGAGTGVTLDILGITRSVGTPPAGSTIGAYENAADAAGPVITYTPLSNTCATGSRTLTASITDPSGVPTAGAGLPVLYWRINAGAWNAATGVFVSGSNYDFTFGAGVVVTDVVQYYIAAQDNAGTPNVSVFPSAGAAGFTINPPAAATPPTNPSSYTIQNLLAAGTYTVGAAGTYPTLNAAFTAYNTSCLGGPVVFNLIDAAYTNTSDTLRANADASAINTLTIKATLAGTTITGNSAQATIVLHGADYIIIDGSIGSTANTVCPLSAASRDLTISNTNAGTSSSVVSLNTTGSGDAATNNTVRNCIITGNTNTTTLSGINISGTAIGNGTGANFNNNNSLINNEVSRAVIGIFTAGSGIATKSANTTINQNVMTTAGTNSIGRFGIMSLLENNLTVSGNSVSGIVNSASADAGGICVGANGGFSTTTMSGGEVTNATITNNTIGVVQQTNTFSVSGIAVLAGTTGTMLIANNMLSGVNANGTSGDFATGIYVTGGTGSTINVYHNTVTMAGTLTGADEASYAFALLSSSPTVNVRNNIFTSTGSTGANRNRAIGLGFALPAANLVSDYNDLFASGTGAEVAQTTTMDNTGGVNHTTLLNWQTNATQDANSKNVLPTFVSATNLHLVTPDGINFTNLESAGVAVSVTNDIDCESRPNGTAHDIGADEFVGAVPACNVPTAVSVGSITTTTASVSFTCTGCVGTFIVEYGLPGFTPGTGATAGAGGTVVTGGASPIALSGLTAATTYDVYVRQECTPGSSYSNNSTVVTFTTLCNPFSIPYSENFDAVTPPAIPVCSFKEDLNGATTWNTSTTNPRSAPNNLTYNWDGVTPGDDWWFTPGLNLTGGTQYRLTFWYRARSASFPESLEVLYGTGQNAASMTSGTLFSSLNFTNTTYIQAVVDFTPGSTGVYYIGFHAISDPDQFDLHVDDINVDLTPTCFPPTGLAVNNITATTADLSWVAPVGGSPVNYEWKVVLQGAGSGGAAVSSGTTVHPVVTATATGLSAQTSYDLFVRTDCGGGGFSSYAGPVTFTTPPANDNAPGALTLTVGAGCTGNPYSNSGATQSAGEPFAACKGSAGFNTVWFQFVAPSSGAVRVTNDFSGGTMGTDSRMSLFSTTNVNDYTQFTNIACDDDNGATVSTRSILYATGLTPGNTYYIQVDGFSAGTAQGTFCLAVDELASSMITTTATACAAGQSLSAYNDNYTGWISATDASGNLIALINNMTGGATTSTFDNSVNINSAAVRQDAVSGQYYHDRNFRITNASVTNANIRFFILNAELSALQGVDAAVTLGNLQATRQTGAACQSSFVAANGTNSSLSQTANGGGTGYSWIQVNTPGLSNFYLNTMRTFVPVKTWLHGAYNSGLARHKDVTATWAAVLNASALSQPYNTAAFGNYAGTETVTAGFFTSTGATTDVVDWVLLELRDATTPSTLITRRAAFVREDGRIVDLDGTSDVSFRSLAPANYFVVIRHRNHLGIRTALAQTADGTMGVAIPAVYDFSTAQAQAFQDPAILALAPPNNNNAMRDLGAGVFGMWAGNANANTAVRASGPLAQNDYLFLISTTLGNDVNLILSNVYSNADMNMDGQVRASGPLSQNDYLFLISTVLGNDVNRVVAQHQ